MNDPLNAKRRTHLSRETLDWLTTSFVRHGPSEGCYHFHRVGTACLRASGRPLSVVLSFAIYKWDDPLARGYDGLLFPYFLNEQSMIDYFEHYNPVDKKVDYFNE